MHTGKLRVFENDEITADSALASACLPTLFQAIERRRVLLGRRVYGNPAIFPLIYGCDSRDVVIVHINPLERPTLPRTADAILNRVNEISFNSSLMHEIRAIAFLSRLIA